MGEEPKHEITRILGEMARDGVEGPAATQRLFEAAIAELHKIADSLMWGERTDHTLQPTALVNEAFLRLIRSEGTVWESRAHFFGTAARSMRQILVDHARGKQAAKRSGGWERVTLTGDVAFMDSADIEILDLDRALNKLAELDRRMADVVELRVFAGMTVDEVAQLLDVSRRTVFNDWRVAKMWLGKELTKGREP